MLDIAEHLSHLDRLYDPALLDHPDHTDHLDHDDHPNHNSDPSTDLSRRLIQNSQCFFCLVIVSDNFFALENCCSEEILQIIVPGRGGRLGGVIRVVRAVKVVNFNIEKG